MPSSITFVAPSGRVDDIARLIVRDYGTVTGLGLDASQDSMEVRRFLELHAGELVEVEYEEIYEDNPVTELSEILDCHMAPYFGYWAAYETRDRSRYDGGFIVRHDDEIHGERRRFAWQNGDPGPYEADMRTAGFPEDQIARIVNQFMPEPEQAPAPAIGM